MIKLQSSHQKIPVHHSVDEDSETLFSIGSNKESLYRFSFFFCLSIEKKGFVRCFGATFFGGIFDRHSKRRTIHRVKKCLAEFSRYLTL